MSTLFDAMGGPERIRLTTELFLRQAMFDDLLADMFAGKFDHAEHISAFFSAILGGPADYFQQRGGLDFVLTQHVGLKITEQQRVRWKTLMISAARDAGVPEPAVAAFANYLEGPSRTAMSVSNLPPDTAYAKLGHQKMPKPHTPAEHQQRVCCTNR